MTGIFYFSWLFGKTWIPDSYKKQVAEEQTLKYESLWGLELDRPDFSLDGWLLYAHSLLYKVLYDKRSELLPRELRELEVIGYRQIARNEGRIPIAGLGKKYLDLLESIKKGVICEDSYSKIEEIINVSSRNELKESINRLHKKRAPADE